MTNPGQPGDTRRWSSRLAAGSVAIIAAIASYTHMRDLALRHGQDELIATLLPLSVDGLMVVAAVAIGDGRRRTWSAWASFVVGVAASIAANVLAARPDLISRTISAWPAIALLLVVEVLSDSSRGRRTATATSDSADDTTAAVATRADLTAPDTPRDTPSAAVAAVPDGDPGASSGAGPADTRTAAVAAVLVGGQTWDAAAASAGVSVRTLRRRAGQALKEADERTRRARGTRRPGHRADDDPVSGPPGSDSGAGDDRAVTETTGPAPINGAAVLHDVTAR